MTAPTSIWTLARGEYSDYRVLCAVKGSEADAEALAARMNSSPDQWDAVFIEELAIVKPDVERVEVLTMSVEININGTIRSERDPHMRVEWPFDSLYGTPAVRWRWVRAPMYQGKAGRLEVWGTDHERVRRVFSDRRAEFLATPSARLQGEAVGGR